MLRVCTTHVPHMNMSCPICECVMSHICISHVCTPTCTVTWFIDMPCHAHARVMSHTWTHMSLYPDKIHAFVTLCVCAAMSRVCTRMYSLISCYSCIYAWRADVCMCTYVFVLGEKESVRARTRAKETETERREKKSVCVCGAWEISVHTSSAHNHVCNTSQPSILTSKPPIQREYTHLCNTHSLLHPCALT